MSLGTALEEAAAALPADADAVRPANGDPMRLLSGLEPEAAARVLGWLLGHAPEAASELVEAWQDEPAGVAVVLSVDASTLPKEGRKALRRARHRLRSRGVAVTEAAPEPVVAALPPIDDDFEVGLVTPLDPAGSRLVYVVEADPSGGARLFEIALDDARGVLDLSVYSASRSKVRGFLREVSQRRGMAGVPAPPGAVRALVARAAARQPEDRRPPADFAEWKGHVALAPPGAEPPGTIVAQELGEKLERELLDQAVGLVREGRVGPWPGDGEQLGGLARRVREKATSELLVTPAQRREQAELALADAQGELYGEAAGAVTAERFRETAYVLWRGGETAAARACLAAAAAFGELAPAENPVARALLEVVFAPLLETLEREMTGEPEKAP